MANPKTTHFPTATYSTANRQVNHALFPAPATSVSSSSSGPANRRTAALHQDEGQKCIIQRGARPSAAAIPNNHPASSSSPSPSSSSSPYISSSTNGPNSRYYPSRDYYDDTAAGNTFPRQDDYRRRPDHPSTYTTSTQHSNSSGKTRPTTFPLNHYVTNPPSSTAAAAAAANSKTSHASTDEDVTPPTLLAGGAVAGKSMNYYYAHDGGSSSGRRDGNDDGRQNSHFHPRSSSSSSAAAAAVLHNSMPQARNSSGGGGGGGTTSIGNNVQSPSPSSPSPQQQQQQNGGGLGYNSDFSLHLHRDTTPPLSMRLSMPFRTAFSRHVGGLGGQQRDNSSGGNNGGGGGRPFGRGDLFREDFMDNDFFDRPFGFTDNPTAAPTGGGGLGRQRSPFLASAFSGAGADDLFAGFDDNESSFPPSSSSSSSQQQYRSHPIQPSAHPMLNSRNHHFSSSSSSSSQDSNGNRGGGGGGDLDGTGEFLHRIIQTDLEPDELEQRVKIFIAQDRARGLDNPNSPTIKQQQQQFPRISARIPHGGSLSFSFSTNGGNTTMRIEDGQVPPHPMLSLDQKKQLKERLLAQKNDFISGPNTSAMILSSEGNEDQESGGKNGVGHQANVGSVAERVMWFEGFPQLQITHHPSGRMHRSAAHIALQNWRNANADFMAMDFPQLPPFASHSYTRSNSTSVEREIPIIREDDSGGKPALPRSSAASITLEVPSNKPVTTTRYGSTADATPSKPGNHALSGPTATPQTSFVTDPLQKAALLKATAPAGRGELKPVERIVPTILPSPEPKPIEKSWLKGDNLKNQEVLKEQEIKPTLVRQIGLKEVKEPEPKSAEVRKASLNIMKALQNGMSREDKKEEPVIKAPIVVPPPVPEKVMPKRASPPKTVTSPRSPPITSPFNYPTAKENVPPFHYPRGKPVKGDSDYILMEKVRKSFNNKPELKLDEMKDLMASLGLPLYWRRPLLLAAAGSGPAKDSVTFEMIWNTWKRITANCYDDASRFVCLLAKPGCNFLLPDDCTPLIQDVVDTHPGLNILKEAPEFHARYINTVIARMFFCINRSWTGRITIEELRRSNFLQVLATLEHEDDINVITDFFSYEHFYVIYCKFWELDRDHDLLIDKTDLARHNDHAISSKMIDRIFSGAVTRGQHQKNGKMSYSEFVWFLIAEEDKRHPRSVEYWFRCMDLDGDGVLSLYELEYFYEEQLQRMKSLGIEALPFEDIACQMLDMVHPKKKDRIILTDLKRCRMTPLFYDSFFNIEKYLLHEHRDPFASAKVDSEDNEPISDWERYAAEEYEMLVSEDAASEDL